MGRTMPAWPFNFVTAGTLLTLYGDHDDDHDGDHDGDHDDGDDESDG